MKSLTALAAIAMMIVSLSFLPTHADYAGWAEAQAKSQIANQILADNMQHMR
jgi:hypothetical protein